MKRLVLSFTIAGFCVLASCRSTSKQTLVSFVPSSSYGVLVLNWRTVKQDGDLKKLVKGDRLEVLLRQSTLDPESVGELVVFGDLENSANGVAGILVKGSFDSKNLVSALRRQGWSEETAFGKTLCAHADGTTCLASLGPNSVVLGTAHGVKAVLEAQSTPALRFTSNAAYKKLSAQFESKRYPILMMAAIPQSTQDMANVAVELSSSVLSFAGAGPFGELIRKIGVAKGFGCAISHEGDLFPTAVVAIMKDEESAKLVSGTLQLLKTLGSMVPPNANAEGNSAAAQSIKRMSIVRSKEVLAIKIAMSRQDLFHESITTND